MQHKNIILIGMPGSGKSTLGVLLAKQLCMDFVDTDLLIQNTENRPLQQIILEEGVESFLTIEDSIMNKLSVSNFVIATGGSAVLSPQGLKHLKEQGITIYLELCLKTIEDRLSNIKTRGIIMKENEGLSDIYQKRVPLYEEFADQIINCDDCTTQECIEKIMKII